ncbi:MULTISPECIES: hypothetical protein [unclassified Sutcliffiella]|uniref:hypothetical protein n=1 Tax=unclassified Sutcliffiella TaxID=2837532 RepID=UPI0030D46C59
MVADNRLEVRIKAITKVTNTIKRFTFMQTNEEPLPAFSAGSHIIVYMKGRGA